MSVEQIKRWDPGMAKGGSMDKKRVIRKKTFEGYDFSAAEITNTIWKKCVFANCRFDKTIFKNTVFVNCRFSDLAFSGCRFESCQLAVNSGRHSGVFENVQFEHCSLVRSDFYFPIIRSCRFIDNIYTETDFDGSRFYDCRFTGEMDAVEFRGYSVLAITHWKGLIQRVDPKKYRNPMENVDFSEARFRHVGFSNGINLANCRFPDDGNSFMIVSPRPVFSKARAIIENTWDTKDKKRALHLIDTFLFSRTQESMPQIFYYKRPVAESLQEFEDRLFNLLKEIGQDQGI